MFITKGPWWATGSPLGRSLSVREDGTPVVVETKTSGVLLGHVTLIADEALGDDIRAEMDLLRAELDMLKRAFRRHSRETG